jgi:hypothetical protein
MSETADIMESFRTQLRAAQPARVVSRDWKDFAKRDAEDQRRGVYTVLPLGEGGFPNYVGREAEFGALELLLLAQIKVGEDSEPHEVEDAESVMIDEIKSFCAAAPQAPIDSLVLTALRRSGQLEHPYGWVAFSLEVMT